jgi:hypothetical protein
MRGFSQRRANRNAARVAAFAAAALVAMLAAGCMVPPHPVRWETEGGFLGAYGELRQEPGESGQRVHAKAGVPWGTYTKVLIEPVALFRAPLSDLSRVSGRDLQDFLDHVEGALRRALAGDYRIVRAPGPGVLRVRAAVCDTPGATVALDFGSAAVSRALVLPEGRRLPGATKAFVRGAALECEILDSVRRTRFLAVVDARAGSGVPEGPRTLWRDARAAADAWAARLAARLAALRGGT